MPPKIDFIAEDSEPDFTPDNPERDSVNINDPLQVSIKLQPHQMGGLVRPEDITTGPNRTINPITKRDDSEGFWSKLLNLPEARKEARTDDVMFNSGIDYSKVGDYIKGKLPEGKIGNTLGVLGSIAASLPEGILSDPTSPALGFLGAAKPRAIEGRLKAIRDTPVEPLPLPKKQPKLLPPHTGMIADDIGNIVPNKLVPGPLGNDITPDLAARLHTDFPDSLRHELSGGIPAQDIVPPELPSAVKTAKKIDFVPDTPVTEKISNVNIPEGTAKLTLKNPTANQVAELKDKGYVVSSRSSKSATFTNNPKVVQLVNNDAGIVSSSTSDKLAALAKDLFSDTEGSLKPKELVENTKKLFLRGKTNDDIANVRQAVLDHLVNLRSVDVSRVYNQVSNKMSPVQFEKVLNDIIDSGDLQKAYKSKTKLAQGVVPSAGNVKPATLEDSLASLSDAIGQHQQARLAQDEIVRGEKAQRASKLEELSGKGYSGYQRQREVLKGEYSKADIKPITDAANNVNMDEMMNMVDSKLPDQFQAFRAKAAISKVFGLSEMKGALQPNEIDLLTKVFGPELTAKLQQMNSVFGVPDGDYEQVGKDLARYSNLAKSIQASMDLSAPLRQGAPLAGRKEFWPAAWEMFKYAGKESKYKALQDYLSNDWKHRDLAKASRLSITRIGSDMKDLPKEEHFLSELPEKIPGLGRLYRGSERAYVGFLDKLRADTFSSLVDDLSRAGIKTHDTVKVNMRDKATGKMITVDKIVPSQEVLDTAKFINTATGRGSLGPAEKYGDLLNTIFYSPRFQASRLDLMTKFLRPDTYTKLSPALRTEYLKSLLSMGGIATTVNGIGVALGGKLTSDLRSSDFGKVIYHDKTRQDPGAGFLQYLTLAARMVTNETTSTRTGKTSELGQKFGSPDRMDVLGSFARNKLSPIPGLAVSAIKGKNNLGEEFNMLDETGKLMVPLLIQDITDILKNDPKAYPLIVPATLGQGISVYNDLKKKKEKKEGSFLNRELLRKN